MYWKTEQRKTAKHDEGLKNQRKTGGDVIVLPEIGKQGGDRAAGMEGGVRGRRVIEGKARPQPFRSGRWRARVVQEISSRRDKKIHGLAFGIDWPGDGGRF